MKYLKRWLIKLIADDIRRGGEIAKAVEQRTVIIAPSLHEAAITASVIKALTTALPIKSSSGLVERWKEKFFNT